MRPETVAAVLLEGVVGPNGVHVPPPGYWRRVRALCDRFGILLIADEVLSGFGRTGRWFALDHDGVSPDLLTCAKGLTAGYAPGGAVVVHPRVARYFDDHMLYCGLTAYAHPLTCAAIATAIDIYRNEKLIERAAQLGLGLEQRLSQLKSACAAVRAFRGVGLLWAIEVDPACAQKLVAALRAQHVHMHHRDNLFFVAPPLVATETDLDEGLAAFEVALRSVS
jgi:taurine--2-oxoglutarate transaminase